MRQKKQMKPIGPFFLFEIRQNPYFPHMQKLLVIQPTIPIVPTFRNMDPKLWTAKVRELANMGIEYLVFMEVANEGKAYYPSKLMPWLYNDKLQSPVDAIHAL